MTGGACGDLTARLGELVAERLGGAVLDRPTMRRLSGGSNRETWSFDAVGADGRVHPLILQRRSSTLPDLFGVDAATEGAVLRAAAAAGVPVPRVVADSADSALLGQPFLLAERVEGETIPPRLLRGDEFATARTLLVRQYGEALGRIQSLPIVALPRLDDAFPLTRYRRLLAELGHPRPALELGLRWLAANLPPAVSSEPVLVHGDYRNGNGIVGPEGLRAVIDWEFAHLGDPLEDLAWFCLRAWRFGRSEPAGGLGGYGPLIEGYTGVAGREVEGEALHWWMVLGTIRWGIICAVQAQRHLSGQARSVELAAVGRRVCEAEFDLLALLP